MTGARGVDRASAPAVPTCAVPAGAPPAARGIALGLWGGTDAAAVATDLDEIVAAGATDVALVVTWSQPDVRASRIAAGERTASDALIAAALDGAAARGLRATLFPILTLDEVGPGDWRGTVRPADRDAWWTSYETFILHHAELAAAHGATGLVIGSELGSTETWRDRWYHLISRVERRFSGTLIYSANWDHYQHVSFWRRVDVFGVTGYFELTGDRDAGEDELVRAWAAPRTALLAAARAAGKPLWLTEVGYPSIDGGAVRPWDYTARGRVDLEEQRRAFAALARAWGGQALAGIFVWEWSGAGGADDRGYTPRAKPAGCVLSAWFGAAP